MAAKKENNISEYTAKVTEFKPKPSKRKLSSKKVLVTLAMLGVLLTVFGLIHHSWTEKQKPSPATGPAANLNMTPTQKAQYLADQGNYKVAEQTWQSQLDTAPDEATKLGIYYQQSSLAVRFKQYNEAKRYAEEAKKLAPNSPTAYVALAHLAEAQNDKTAAKQYWQQAIALLDQNSLNYDLTKRDYQTSLDGLK